MICVRTPPGAMGAMGAMGAGFAAAAGGLGLFAVRCAMDEMPTGAAGVTLCPAERCASAQGVRGVSITRALPVVGGAESSLALIDLISAAAGEWLGLGTGSSSAFESSSSSSDLTETAERSVYVQ